MERYLLVGETDWTRQLPILPDAYWYFARPGEVAALLKRLLPKKPRAARVVSAQGLTVSPRTWHLKKRPAPKESFRGFTAAYFASLPTAVDLVALFKYVDAYKVVCLPELLNQPMDEQQTEYFRLKLVRPLALTNGEAIATWLQTRLFDGQVGTKHDPASFEVNPHFQGMVEYNGFLAVNLEGDFGPSFQPIGTYKWGAYIDPGKSLQLWPEFTHSAGVEIRLVVYEAFAGNPYSFDRRLVFSEQELQNEVVIMDPSDRSFGGGVMNMVIEAKGQGWLSIGSLHYRWSRLGAGKFLAGGQRLVGQDRRELNVYFNPGDGKPPLNVYFSGYRTAEGFEAFYMMRSLKAPFILVADPRLEGGGFYLGDEKLEQQLIGFIQGHLQNLGFDRHQLICSGMSMGSFGAFYYGSQLGCHSIIVTKPILNLGRVAANEQQLRFGGFATSLDILNYHLSKDQQIKEPAEQVRALNRRFWKRFTQADIDATKLMLAYMQDDDYDRTAYPDLLKALGQTNKHPYIISRGLPGHHNDGAAETVTWFKQQYRTVLRQDFNR